MISDLAVTLIISLVGAFISLCLVVNAFFLRGIFEDLNTVKIKIAELFIELTNRKEKTDGIIKEQKAHTKLIEDLKDRINKVEGGQNQFLEYLKEIKE